MGWQFWHSEFELRTTVPDGGLAPAGRRTNSDMGPAFHGGIPIRIHVSRPSHTVLQINWALWLCDCCIVSGLVRNVELINAFRSLSTEGKLKVNRLRNSG